MNIGIIDADYLDSKTKFPNLALMKISGYHKQRGDNVEFTGWEDYNKFDHTYVSKVFDYTYSPEMIKFQSNVTLGGTGFFFDNSPKLTHEMEHTKPDYNLYSFVQNDSKHKYYHISSIGFTTRGCFRKCSFCVNRNNKKVVKWSDIEEFYDDSKKVITLLDDNILGYKNRKDIINKLIDYNKPFEYKQGMDIRLIDDEIAEMFTNAKYYGDFIFAFDDWNERNEIVPKIEQWQKWHADNKKNTKFYTLVAYKSTDAYDIKEAFERIRELAKQKCLPYIMRHKKYEKSEFRGMYINLARWCNQPSIFKKMTFREFVEKHPEESATYAYSNEFERKYNEIANEFYDFKYGEIN